MTSNKKEDVLKRAYQLISESENGITQSELWKKLEISSRKGSQIVKELVEKGLVDRERVLHEGRWTYKLFIKKKEKGIDLIKDIYCLVCPHEPRCSKDEPKYLIKCIYLEDWAMRKYLKHLSESYRGEEKQELD